MIKVDEMFESTCVVVKSDDDLGGNFRAFLCYRERSLVFFGSGGTLLQLIDEFRG